MLYEDLAKRGTLRFMDQPSLKITMSQAEETIEFLTSLDYKWLTLDWTRQKLCSFFFDAFGKVIDERQANSVLHFFRDYRFLTLVTVPNQYCQYRWERVQLSEVS